MKACFRQPRHAKNIDQSINQPIDRTVLGSKVWRPSRRRDIETIQITMKRPRPQRTKANAIVKRRLPLKFRCPTHHVFDLPVSTTAVTRQVSDEDLDVNNSNHTGNDTDTTEKMASPRRRPVIQANESPLTRGFAPSSATRMPETTSHSVSDTSLDGKQQDRQQPFLKRRAKSMCLADLASSPTKDMALANTEPTPSPNSTASSWGLFVDLTDERIELRHRRPLRFRRRAPLKGFVLSSPTVDETAQALDQLCVSRSF